MDLNHDQDLRPVPRRDDRRRAAIPREPRSASKEYAWESALVLAICAATLVTLYLPGPSPDMGPLDAERVRRNGTLLRIAVALLTFGLALIAARQSRSNAMKALLMPACVIAVGMLLAGDTLDNLRGAVERTDTLIRKVTEDAEVSAKAATRALRAVRKLSAMADRWEQLTRSSEQVAREAVESAARTTAQAEIATLRADQASRAAAAATGDATTLKYQTQFDVHERGAEARNGLFHIAVYGSQHGEWGHDPGRDRRDRAALGKFGFRSDRMVSIAGNLGDSGVCQVLYYSPSAWDQAMCVQIVLDKLGWRGWGKAGPLDTEESPKLVHNPERSHDLQLMLSGCTAPTTDRLAQVPPDACSIGALAKAAAAFRGDGSDAR